jgi:hypothetical protein
MLTPNTWARRPHVTASGCPKDAARAPAAPLYGSCSGRTGGTAQGHGPDTGDLSRASTQTTWLPRPRRPVPLRAQKRNPFAGGARGRLQVRPNRGTAGSTEQARTSSVGQTSARSRPLDPCIYAGPPGPRFGG